MLEVVGITGTAAQIYSELVKAEQLSVAEEARTKQELPIKMLRPGRDQPFPGRRRGVRERMALARLALGVNWLPGDDFRPGNTLGFGLLIAPAIASWAERTRPSMTSEASSSADPTPVDA